MVMELAAAMATAMVTANERGVLMATVMVMAMATMTEKG
jgi:hypothetical protein